MHAARSPKRQRRASVLDSIGHVPREIVRRSRIVSKKAYITVDQSLQNNFALSRAKLVADHQFRGSA
jgi:hypothetical protein